MNDKNWKLQILAVLLGTAIGAVVSQLLGINPFVCGFIVTLVLLISIDAYKGF